MTIKGINFKVTDADFKLIDKIVERAIFVSPVELDRLSLEMDIAATHLNGNPLKLQELLEADHLTFVHDVFGIRRHINRKTGQLEDFFSPRYSV